MVSSLDGLLVRHGPWHLVAIFEYIARDSRLYAERVVDRLTIRSEQIGQFPYLGRAVPEVDDDRIREMIKAPYRIIYRVDADRVVILAVVHSAQSGLPALLYSFGA